MTIFQRRILRAFLGTPGDLTDERSAARRLVDEINRSLRDLDWQVDLLGWEDTLPGRSRPQQLINDDIVQCNLFIGILWHRWGSATGTYSSGFEEEYELARRLSRERGEPEVWLFLKDIDPERRADPGEQLSQVLNFRNRIQSGREVLYKPFIDVDEFVILLREALLRYVFRLQTESSASDLMTPEQPPVDAMSESSGAIASQGNTEQVVHTLRRIADALASGESIEAWEAARLRLTASTVFSSAYSAESLTAHPVNVLYASGRGLVLTDRELYTVLRSILTGWDAVPGWRWLSDGAGESLLDGLAAIAVVDNNERVRVRAVSMLAYARVPPRDLADGEGTFGKVLLQDKSPSVVEASVDYLAAVVADCETVDSLLPALRDEQRELQARLLQSVDPARAIAVLLSGPGNLSLSELARYEESAHFADETLLRSALTDPRGRVRMFALRELARRRVLTSADISGHLADKMTAVRREAARALVADPETEYASAHDAVKAVNSERPWEEDLLMRQAIAKLSNDALAERIYYFESDYDDAYALLGERGDARVVDRLRSDLSDEFQTWDAESVARLVSQHGEAVAEYIAERSAELKDFVVSQMAGAALSVLVETSKREDAVLARQYLSSRSNVAKLASIRILGWWGSDDDSAALLSMARDGYGDVKEAATAALIAIDPALEGGAASLLKSDDAVHVRHALGQLINIMPERAISGSLEWLYSETEGVRRLACAALVQLHEPGALAAILAEYQRASKYFYDVVVWLDTILYAPTALSEGFRAELQASFVGSPP